MNQVKATIDQIPKDQLILGLFILGCLIIAIIGSNIAFRYSRRKIMLRKMGAAIDFEKERRSRNRLRLFKLAKLKRINPLVVIIVGAAIGFAVLNIVGEPEGSRTGSSSVLTARVTHVRMVIQLWLELPLYGSQTSTVPSWEQRQANVPKSVCKPW